MRFRTVLVFFLITVSCLSVDSAPRSKPKAATFDQKQTGDYNIRLHLKDFQIIAIVGGEAFGSMNDNYEYDYEIPEEYLDVTLPTNTSLAPTTLRTTRKPTSQTTTTKTRKPEISTTQKPTVVYFSSEAPSTTSKIAAMTFTTEASTPKSERVTRLEAPAPKPESTAETEATSERLITVAVGNVTNTLETLALDKIPVVVMQGNFDEQTNDVLANKRLDVVTNVAIVPVPEEDSGGGLEEHPIALGEILHYKRCAQGYTRDKRGRCRKLRRPPLPFNIARLATNWVARLKQSKEESAPQKTGN